MPSARIIAMSASLAIAPVCAAGEAATPDGAAPQLSWQQLPPLPDKLGVAGPFAGVSGGALLVAGGANFPDKMPWEGGKKVWHDAIYALTATNGEWKLVGRLPRPLARIFHTRLECPTQCWVGRGSCRAIRSAWCRLGRSLALPNSETSGLAYGVSVSIAGGVLCIGGSDAERHHAEVFQLQWRDGRVEITDLKPLPIPLANAAGAVIGKTVYVAGGSEAPGEQAASRRCFALDLALPSASWREIEPLPGKARILPVAAALDGAFYVMGGAALEPVDGQVKRVYLHDAWRFRPDTGWQRIADLPKPAVAAPSPAPAAGSRLFLLGGDDGSLANFQPVEKHPGFPKAIVIYDAARDAWRVDGTLPASRATAPVAEWNGRFVIPSGEARPGVRSPEVWEVRVK